MEGYNLVSLMGIFVLIGIAWLFSTHRKRVNWRIVFWGTGIQLGIALMVFVVPAGAKVFLFANDVVVKILQSATEGARFVFGPLAVSPGAEGSLGFILAFQGLPTIIFFSALVAVLYHYGIMQMVIRGFAWVFSKTMRTSGAESLSAASNIFVGVESAFTVRPHLSDMTRSELCTILTAGMATVASNVLALYVFILQGQFPTIAGHLISASLLSAPAALIMSKLFLPETGSPKTQGENIRVHHTRENNVFEAVINSANAGVRVIAGIVALLIAVLGLVALLDMVVGGTGEWINSLMGISLDWSFRGLLGYLFYPFAIVLGIPPADAAVAGRIIGERLVLTEIASYKDLAAALEAGTFQYGRSAVIVTYALCGFAHVASMAIFVGGVSALAPGRTRTLSKVAFRALVAATFACLMTACIAGTFYNGESILLG